MSWSPYIKQVMKSSEMSESSIGRMRRNLIPSVREPRESELGRIDLREGKVMTLMLSDEGDPVVGTYTYSCLCYGKVVQKKEVGMGSGTACY